MPQYDAILVPGGGVRAGGILPSWVRRRFGRAIELHEGAYIVALSAGTTHRPPPLDPAGFPIFESVAGANYLRESGIPADRILIETHSYDTIGNAFFSRVIHTDPLGLRRLLVVTSDFHLERIQLAFDWIYRLTPRTLPYELHFEGVADPDMDPYLWAERSEKERRGIEALKPLTQSLTSMRDFHRWLFTEHSAYSAASARPRQHAGDALDSY
jgi:hypothetical protein